MTDKYNTTQLDPLTTFERHVFHRDQFAHYLRWSYVLNNIKFEEKILDIACGSGNLLEVLYRNRHKCARYLGVDIRNETINKATAKFRNVEWASFKTKDLIENDLSELADDWNYITAFEVIEHVGKANTDLFCQKLASLMNDKTTLLLSTPNFDAKVGPADNHIVNGVIGEFEHNELKTLLEKYFIIEKRFGTFASMKDYKHLLNESQLALFNQLKEYYDSNLISVIFAPMFPEQARNCLWVLKRK